MNNFIKAVVLTTSFAFGLFLFSGASPVPTPSLSELSRAQQAELKAFEVRHKAEMKELKNLQNIAQKEWEKKEREARHKYFEEHPSGDERRNYVKNFIQRRDAFRKSLLDQKKQHQVDYELQYSELWKQQKERLDHLKKP